MSQVQQDKHFGGKGNSLLQLKEGGFCVPEFICLDIECFEEAKNASFRVSEIIQYRIDKFISQFPSDSFAVRSSANMEDGSQHSFAGLFETFLDLKNIKEILQAVQKCWASAQSVRVSDYCKRKNIDSQKLKMGVVIQRFINPDYAGVAFTLNPITGNDQEILVEIVRGVGESLVSGRVTPERWILNRDPRLNVILRQEGDASGIPKGHASILRETFKRIQAYYGKPQDIEWAIFRNEIYILQSRDITSYQFSNDLGEWTTADFRDGGVSSAVVSPVMWSLYESVFATSMPEYLHALNLISTKELQETCWYKVFYGRPYWNLEAVKKCQSVLPGYSEKNFDQDMAIPITYEGQGVETPVTLWGIFKALPVLFKLHRGYKNQLLAAEKFLEIFPSIEENLKNIQWENLSDFDLYKQSNDLFYKTYHYVETTYFNTIYNASNAKMEFFDDLKKMKKVDPDIEYVKLIADLGSLGVTNSVFELWKLAEKHRDSLILNHSSKLKLKNLQDSLPPLPMSPPDLIEIIKDSKFQELKLDLDCFFEKYYFHSPRELDLQVKRWKEDPLFIMEIFCKLLNEASEEKSPENLARKRKLIFEDELALLEGVWKKNFKLKLTRQNTMKKLKRVRRFLWLREELRDHSTRIYYFLRQMLLETGRRFQVDSLVFYLTIEEVFQLQRGSMSTTQAITVAKERKLYADGYSQFQNPNEIGARYNSIRSRAVGSGVLIQSDGRPGFSGIGCSAGIYQGAARVIRELSDAHKVMQGDILITAFTDPGWTPIFSLVGAVITETGGLLSHAALISREYGIPCVLNVHRATEIFSDGDIVEVNGTQGIVSKMI